MSESDKQNTTFKDLHVRFMDEISSLIGSGFLDKRGVKINEDTTFDELSFSIIDECWVEHMVHKIYGMSSFAPAEWPDTVGSLLGMIEKEIRVEKARSRATFTDNDNLIYVSYAGGACGYALRYILLMSPGTDGNDQARDMSEQGSAHNMLTRSGIGNMADGQFQQLCLADIPEMLHMPSVAWFNGNIDKRLVDRAKFLINSAKTFRGEDLRNWRRFGTWVWADHLIPSIARMIFPNAKIIALRRDSAAATRDFVLKYQMETIGSHVVSNGFEKNLLNIDYSVRRLFRPNTRLAYKDVLRSQTYWISQMQDLITSDAAATNTYVVDVDRLLNLSTWRDEYDRLLGMVGLQPSYEDVETFLRGYIAKQYDREDWVPNPEWNWVKLGPNRPGRW